ncbi:hypothetical protein G9A89_011930 [Geosiphon pyriformis]|nr:hypothetical protein G9A89_011930 [Geosiphon pyriformis]
MSVSQPLASIPFMVANLNFLSDMVLDNPNSLFDTFLPIATDSLVFGLSSFKVLTSKLNSLKSKFVALEVSVNFILVSLVWKVAMCNIRGMNNPVKQDDIIHWHKKMNNVILIVTKTKLKSKIRSWIMNKFDGVWVFTSGLNSGYLGSGVAIIMNNFLAQHIYKVLDIPGQFLFLRLLFKNNLSVLVLGLYAGASLAVCFSQANNVNFLIARVVNKSSFIILGSDFNKDGSHKSASFKRCFDLGLVNSLIAKTIDYVFVLSNLVNAILDRDIAGIEEFFDTDHRIVFVSVGLGGLLDVQLNSLHKQMNKDCWKKFYHASKLLESKCAENFYIRSAINRKMESFESNKGHTIRNVLERSFHKVVLDHLVVGEELILEPNHVKNKVDEIMESWTQK